MHNTLVISNRKRRGKMSRRRRLERWKQKMERSFQLTRLEAVKASQVKTKPSKEEKKKEEQVDSSLHFITQLVLGKRKRSEKIETYLQHLIIKTVCFRTQIKERQDSSGSFGTTTSNCWCRQTIRMGNRWRETFSRGVDTQVRVLWSKGCKPFSQTWYFAINRR